jgi:hypothetical protein
MAVKQHRCHFSVGNKELQMLISTRKRQVFALSGVGGATTKFFEGTLKFARSRLVSFVNPLTCHSLTLSLPFQFAQNIQHSALK